MPTSFPQTVEVASLETRHPDVSHSQELFDNLSLLYSGGKELRDNGSRFLTKHSKELSSTYSTRLAQLNYTNLLATITSWYSSRLFENQLEIDWKVDGVAELPEPTRTYYSSFLEDVDHCGTSLDRFFERASIEVLVYGRSYFLIDLPRLAQPPQSLSEQMSLGGLSPYLVHVDPHSVINYSLDPFGCFEWVVIRTTSIVQEFLSQPQTVDKWTYYDKKQYAVYTASRPTSGSGGNYPNSGNKPRQATLVDSGIHATAAFDQVPLTCIKGHHKYWLGQRCYLPLIAHLNMQNAYEWSLHLANVPLPVFTNGKDTNVSSNTTAAEYSSIILPFEATFKWVEPEGKSFDASQKFLETSREEIFRSCHLVSQGRSSRASASVQSAVSKEIDMQPAADVLNVFGTLIRTTIQTALSNIAQIRDDGTAADVRGMNFSDDTTGTTVDLVIAIQALNIPSPTYKNELQKKIVRLSLRDANADLIQTCIDEIETAPEPVAVPGEAAPAATEPQVNLNITERTSV